MNNVQAIAYRTEASRLAALVDAGLITPAEAKGYLHRYCTKHGIKQ